MRNYLLNIMEEFPSNSELHVMAIMLLHFAIYMTENILKKKKKSQICLCTFHGNLFEFLDLPVKNLGDSQFENNLESYFCQHPNIWLSLEQQDIDFVLN